eukprot:gene16160-biopygen3751
MANFPGRPDRPGSQGGASPPPPGSFGGPVRVASPAGPVRVPTQHALYTGSPHTGLPCIGASTPGLHMRNEWSGWDGWCVCMWFVWSVRNGSIRPGQLVALDLPVTPGWPAQPASPGHVPVSNALEGGERNEHISQMCPIHHIPQNHRIYPK